MYYPFRNEVHGDALKYCTAYKTTSHPVGDENDVYETIPLRPLHKAGPPLPPARGSGPTSPPLMNEYDNTHEYENTRPQTIEYHNIKSDSALQYREAIVSGQARSTAPSLSSPYELGGDEHLYESTCTQASAAMPTWKQKI